MRILSAVFSGSLLVWCITRGYVAGAILAGVWFAMAMYVLYIRMIYVPRLRRATAVGGDAAQHLERDG